MPSDKKKSRSGTEAKGWAWLGRIKVFLHSMYAFVLSILLPVLDWLTIGLGWLAFGFAWLASLPKVPVIAVIRVVRLSITACTTSWARWQEEKKHASKAREAADAARRRAEYDAHFRKLKLEQPADSGAGRVGKSKATSRYGAKAAHAKHKPAQHRPSLLGSHAADSSTPAVKASATATSALHPGSGDVSPASSVHSGVQAMAAQQGSRGAAPGAAGKPRPADEQREEPRQPHKQQQQQPSLSESSSQAGRGKEPDLPREPVQPVKPPQQRQQPSAKQQQALPSSEAGSSAGAEEEDTAASEPQQAPSMESPGQQQHQLSPASSLASLTPLLPVVPGDGSSPANAAAAGTTKALLPPHLAALEEDLQWEEGGPGAAADAEAVEPARSATTPAPATAALEEPESKTAPVAAQMAAVASLEAAEGAEQFEEVYRRPKKPPRQRPCPDPAGTAGVEGAGYAPPMQPRAHKTGTQRRQPNGAAAEAADFVELAVAADQCEPTSPQTIAATMEEWSAGKAHRRASDASGNGGSSSSSSRSPMRPQPSEASEDARANGSGAGMGPPKAHRRRYVPVPTSATSAPHQSALAVAGASTGWPTAAAYRSSSSSSRGSPVVAAYGSSPRPAPAYGSIPAAAGMEAQLAQELPSAPAAASVGSVASSQERMDFAAAVGALSQPLDWGWEQQQQQAEGHAAVVPRLGLSNEVGEYNCFLNAIVQCLWHCADFRQQVASWPEALRNHSAVLHAVHDLFAKLEQQELERQQPGGQQPPLQLGGTGGASVVSPNQLREALSALPGRLFQLGEMNDASEVLHTLYELIKEGAAACTCSSSSGGIELLPGSGILLPGSDGSSSPAVDLDSVVGLAVREYVWCAGCALATHSTRYTQYFYNTQATAVREMWRQQDGCVSGLGQLLRLIDDSTLKSCDTDKGGCGMRLPAVHVLERLPRMFALQLAWESLKEEPADIAATLAAIGEQLDLGEVYRGLPPGPHLYRLRSLVCYYGEHYFAFVLLPPPPQPQQHPQQQHQHQQQEGGVWAMFDDTRVARVGAWSDVCRKCELGRMQPSVLFFEAAGSGSGEGTPEGAWAKSSVAGVAPATISMTLSYQ